MAMALLLSKDLTVGGRTLPRGQLLVMGGDQVYPFIISPERLGLGAESLEDARDIHRTILSRYAAANAPNAPPSAAQLTPIAPQAAV